MNLILDTFKQLYLVQLPKEHSIQEMVAFIGHNMQNEHAIEEATNILKKLTEYEPFNISLSENQQLLLTLMTSFASDVNIIENVFNILEKSLALFVNENDQNRTPKQIHLSTKFLEKIFHLFLKYGDSKDMLLYSIKVIVQLANFEEITNHLASYNVIRYLLETLNKFDLDIGLSALTCKAIWCLCSNGKN